MLRLPWETTEAALDILLADLGPSFRNAKHRTQWKSMLQNHAGAIMAMPVAEVSTEDVLKALRPIWTEKPVTAKRMRERIERVLDSAKVRGARTGENPARWRGHLSLMLPRRKAVVQHHTPCPTLK